MNYVAAVLAVGFNLWKWFEIIKLIIMCYVQYVGTVSAPFSRFALQAVLIFCIGKVERLFLMEMRNGPVEEN